MASNFDIAVAGAGHSSLIAAAYLAAAGLKVIVLERNPWIGGGVVTQEVTVPGFKHDLHSNSHNLLQANPLIRNDELGLQAKYGLKYIRPEVSVASIFDDGSSFLLYHDLDKTCESMAKFSERDAESYRSYVDNFRKLLPMFVSGLFSPPAPFGMFMGLLEQSREGRALIGVMNMSAYDIINDIFEDDRIKINFMKFSSEAMAGPEEKGTGLIFSMMAGFVHTYHGGFPVGGSAALVDSLAAFIRAHGGEIRTESHVSKVLIESGRAVGVALESGEEIRAKRAVIGCFHPHVLGDYVAGLDEQILEDARKTHSGPYSGIVVNYALNRPITYPALAAGTSAMIVECLPSNLEMFRREFDDLRYGRIPETVSLVANQHAILDPTRVPEGKGSLYLYSFAPYDLADGGPSRWDDIREREADRLLDAYRPYTNGIGPDDIIARHIATPLDHEKFSLSFRKGDISGIGRYIYQFLGRRPTAELSQYSVPSVDGLYLCGPFMHPGGGVMGGGRAVAVKIMGDLDIDFDRVLARI